jgi:hypothetical protein
VSLAVFWPEMVRTKLAINGFAVTVSSNS